MSTNPRFGSVSVCAVMLCLVGLTGCGASSTPETVFKSWSTAVSSGNFRGSWECLTPQTRGTVLQIMMLDADLLSSANASAKTTFGQVFEKHGLNPQDPGFAQKRLTVSDPAELAADLDNVFRQFMADLGKLPGSRYAKLNAIWTASAQASLSASKLEGTRATAAVQGKIPHTPENSSVQAVFEKVNSRWLFAELEPVTGGAAVASAAPGKPGMPGSAMPGMPGGTMPGMPNGNTPPSSAPGAQVAMAGGAAGAMPTPPGGILPANPGSPMPANPGGPMPANPGGPMPANPGGLTPPSAPSTPPGGTTPPSVPGAIPGGIDPKMMQPKPPATPPGGPANPGAMPADPKAMMPKPGGAPAGAPGAEDAPKNMPAEPANPGAGNPAMANPGNGGIGKQGTQKRESQFKTGSFEYVVTEFSAKIAEGDYTGLDYLISSKAKGLLAEIRDGEISDDKKDDLKATFASAAPQENTRKNKGAVVEIYVKGKLGHMIQLGVGKEDGVFKVKEMKIHEPGATKKR